MDKKDIITLIFGFLGLVLLFSSYFRKHKEYHDNIFLILTKCNAIKLSIKYIVIYILIVILFLFNEPQILMYLIVHAFFFLFFGIRILAAKEQVPDIEYEVIESKPAKDLKGEVALLTVKLEHLPALVSKFPVLTREEITDYINQFTERFKVTFSEEGISRENLSKDLDESISKEIQENLTKNGKKIIDGINALERTLLLMQQTFNPDTEVIASKTSRLNHLLDERTEIIKNI
jgi:hypothetical protein